MIVDLARNDLGRVCVPGSIHVPDAVRGRVTPGAAPPGEHRPRPAARRRRHRRAGRGHLPAGVGHRRAQAAGAPGHRGPRAGAPRRLLRRVGLDRHRPPATPSSPSPSARSRCSATATTAAPTSASAAASSPTPTPTPSGRETELKAGRLLAVAGADTARSGRVVIGADARLVWIDGALLAADAARVSPFDHGLLVGDGVFETIRVYDGQPFAWTRHLDRLAHSAARARARGPRPRAAARRGRRRPRRQRARRRPAAHHGHRRGRAARVRARRGPPTVIVASSAVKPWPRVGTGGRGAVGAQRPRRDRGAEDHVVRRERAGARVRARTRRERGDLRQHPRRAVRGHRLERVRRPRRRGGNPTGIVGLSARRDARAGARAARHAGHRDRRATAPARRACATPTRRSSRRPPARCSRSPRVDDRALPDAPGPVTVALGAAFADLVARDLDP